MMSRRTFLKNVSLVSLLGTDTYNAFAQMSGLSFSNTYKSKALVFVQLDGGNDAAHMIVPISAQYNDYKQARPQLAHSLSDLLPIPATGLDSSGKLVNLGLHPSMKAFAKLCNQGGASVIANCGVLSQSINKEMFNANRSLAPQSLFMHEPQRKALEQASFGEKNDFPNWAQRLLNVLNVQEFNSTKGLVKPFFTDQDLMAQQMITTDQLDLFANNISYPKTDLGLQFKTAAYFISQSKQLNQPQQIFFLKLTGFDTHIDQEQILVNKYHELSTSLAAFAEHLQILGLQEQVITMTTSEFGRRLISSNSGTEHGWGTHQLIMGANVSNQHLIGTWPSYAHDSQDLVADGRLLPTLATEQIYLNLAKWLGLVDNNQQVLNYVFPNHKNFVSCTLFKV